MIDVLAGWLPSPAVETAGYKMIDVIFALIEKTSNWSSIH
jgi:hypothetical protein